VKLPRIGVNFYKVLVGVGFSLGWAKVMYMLWPQPSYITFIWFYLVIGSTIVKWVFFVVIDRIYLKLKLRAVRRVFQESNARVHESTGIQPEESRKRFSIETMNHISLEHGVRQLEHKVTLLGNMVETAVRGSIESVQKQDINLARQIVEHDRELDYERFAIESNCLQLMSTGQAKGSDLRTIVAVLGIITELERMGDYAEGIANIALMIGEKPYMKLPQEIPRMAQKGIGMLRGSVESFTERNVGKARRICGDDDEVDTLYDEVFRKLILFIVEHPQAITQATWLVWIAHNLERFADRATNICERVVFSVTGEIVDIGISKY